MRLSTENRRQTLSAACADASCTVMLQLLCRLHGGEYGARTRMTAARYVDGAAPWDSVK
jgi:hypothetical protein